MPGLPSAVLGPFRRLTPRPSPPATAHAIVAKGMMDTLAWIEQTGLSRFVREDFYAYFVLLIGHAWGMALLVGAGLAVSLRGLGVASGVPMDRLARLYPVMRIGAMLAIVSGLGLLAGYPAKALTNWVFAAKFACLIAAAVLSVRLVRGDADSKVLAALALMLWLGGIAGGKLLLYTNIMLLTSDGGM